jgi:L-idonate 5-dehydrogenase
MAAPDHGARAMTSAAGPAEARRAVVLHGPRDLRVEEQPTDALSEGRVRVRVGAGGICGSDLHYFQHGRTANFVLAEPLILGHEIAGEVIEVALPALAGGIRPGDRVAVNPARFCGQCHFCRTGRANLCDAIFFMGSASRTPHMQGGFAETIVVDAVQCVPVPPNVPLSQAALAEPLAVCLHATARAGPLQGRPVAIVGAGPIGLLLLLVCRWSGSGPVAVIDIARAPLRHATRLGAHRVVDAGDTAPSTGLFDVEHPEVVFEASGSPAGLASALAMVRRGGTIVQVGNLPGGPLPIPANLIMSKELDVKGSFRFADEFGRAVQLIIDRAIEVGGLITAELPLAEAPDAFLLAGDRARSIKVMLRP